MYLLNSISKRNFIAASALTWITTFGRHILDLRYDELSIKVKIAERGSTDEVEDAKDSSSAVETEQ